MLPKETNVVIIIAFVVACCLIVATGFLAVGASRQPSVGFLPEDSLTLADLYDSQTGRALLVPGVPLPPPRPDDTVRIGIIDSGIASAHPQLRTLVVSEKAFVGSDPTDTIRHGTFVALQSIRLFGHPVIQRLFGGQSRFPAIISAKVTDDAGRINVDTVVSAIDWVVEEGAMYVNLSLGFRDAAADYTELCDAIARHADVVFSAGAGNSGPEIRWFPAACPTENVLSAGALRDGVPWQGSGLGDVDAPGGGIFLTPWQYHLDLGLRAAESGEYAAARRAYLDSLAAENNAEAQFRLALLDMVEEDLTSAAIRLEEARRLEPEVATRVAHLGAVRFRQDRFSEAESLFREALVLDGSDQMARFNLGQTLLKLNRPSEALAEFKLLRTTNPEYAGLDAAVAYAKAVAAGREE